MKIEEIDKIYVIHLTQSLDRQEKISKLLNKLNLPFEFWWSTYAYPKGIGEKFPGLKTKYYDRVSLYVPDVYDKVFGTALNHYNIIKTSYERGMNNIMILQYNIPQEIYNN